MSFNQLTFLPPSIGGCSRLEKLRIVDNSIRELPVSILQVRGSLKVGTFSMRCFSGHFIDSCIFFLLVGYNHPLTQELLVERNPLVMPPITAFEMGGLSGALKLLEEHGVNSLHVTFNKLRSTS